MRQRVQILHEGMSMRLAPLGDDYLLFRKADFASDALVTLAKSAAQEIRQANDVEDRLVKFFHQAAEQIAANSGGRAVLVDDEKGLPKSLPDDRPKYRDRQKYPELAHLNAPEFLAKVYADFIRSNDHHIYQFQLAEVDTPLLKGLRNFCALSGEDIASYAKPRHHYLRERAGTILFTDKSLGQDLKDLLDIFYTLARPIRTTLRQAGMPTATQGS